MFKYQKGYIFEGHTFVVNKSDIHNAKDDSFVDGTAFLPAPDIVTNADRIRAMRDEELAELLSDGCAGAVCYDKEQNAYLPAGCYKCRLEWLQQPAEEV